MTKKRVKPAAVRLVVKPGRGRPPVHQETWSKVSVVLFDRQIVHLDRLATEIRSKSEVRGAALSRPPPAAELSEEPVTPDVDALADEGGLKEAVREASHRVEKELILRALKLTSGNVTHAARILKISRKGLQLKMKEHGLREES